MLITDTYIVIPIVLLAAFAAWRAGKLTATGSLAGVFIATGIFFGAGLTGIAMLGAFFVAAVTATSHKKSHKQKLIPHDEHQQRRNAGQVLANGGVAAICGLLAYLMPDDRPFLVTAVAAALASATADTLSSELGTVYGKRFYNIITFRPDEKGSDGVISLEGTLIGTAGAALIALIYFVSYRLLDGAVYIVIAGTVGNLADSLLGATLERKGIIKNDAVNLLNTAIAVAVLWMLMLI